jgi:prepilin-type N-terminal cleavage/methylation domain-containing protein
MKITGYRVKGIGFTLVELLVVLSVIAMLMSILMPALNAARRSAYKTGCKQNLHGCAVAFRMYLDDNRNTMPIIWNMPYSTVKGDANSVALYPCLKKYLSGRCTKMPADSYPKKVTSYLDRKNGSMLRIPFASGRSQNRRQLVRQKISAPVKFGYCTIMTVFMEKKYRPAVKEGARHRKARCHRLLTRINLCIFLRTL